MLRNIGLAAGALMIMGVTSLPAHADLKLCNRTDSRIAAAVGYKDNKGWVTEGWWTIEPKACATLIKGNLVARYHYVYAIDYTKGGSWGGNSIMCTDKKVFTIRGIENCEGRGYQKTGFFEVDTKEETNWTVSLQGDKATQGQ